MILRAHNHPDNVRIRLRDELIKTDELATQAEELAKEYFVLLQFETDDLVLRRMLQPIIFRLQLEWIFRQKGTVYLVDIDEKWGEVFNQDSESNVPAGNLPAVQISVQDKVELVCLTLSSQIKKNSRIMLREYSPEFFFDKKPELVVYSSDQFAQVTSQDVIPWRWL